MNAAPDELLSGIARLLDSSCGLRLSLYDPRFVRGRIRNRLAATSLPNETAYLERLKEDADERHRLAEELNVPVSRFFREKMTMGLLAGRILPELLEQCGRRGVRVWSAGCAGGEEPYTIAFLLEDLIALRHPGSSYRIFASDSDETNLQRGRAGVYDAEAIAAVPTGLCERFLTRTADGRFSVGESLREKVVFGRHDLVDYRGLAPSEAVFNSFDLVICRNLLIYLSAEGRLLALKRLRAALEPEGFLVLGEAEEPGEALGLTGAVWKSQVYRKRRNEA